MFEICWGTHARQIDLSDQGRRRISPSCASSKGSTVTRLTLMSGLSAPVGIPTTILRHFAMSNTMSHGYSHEHRVLETKNQFHIRGGSSCICILGAAAMYSLRLLRRSSHRCPTALKAEISFRNGIPIAF